MGGAVCHLSVPIGCCPFKLSWHVTAFLMFFAPVDLPEADHPSVMIPHGIWVQLTYLTWDTLAQTHPLVTSHDDTMTSPYFVTASQVAQRHYSTV